MKIIQQRDWDAEGRRIQDIVVECFCGAHVECYGFTTTCDRCGADFNSSGQVLADRSQWGEETGESLSDILNIR